MAVKPSKPPAAVICYMQEYGESESDVKAYILEELKFLKTIGNQVGTQPEQWIAFKLRSNAKAAAAAIEWARA